MNEDRTRNPVEEDVNERLCHEAKCIETACAFSVRGGRIVSCGGRRSPLRRRASSTVRGFDFPCTRVEVPLYGQTGYTTRGVHSPYTDGAFSLHRGSRIPTRICSVWTRRLRRADARWTNRASSHTRRPSAKSRSTAPKSGSCSMSCWPLTSRWR